MSEGGEQGGRLAARLAARIAHDLNNSLAIFSGHIFLLQDASEPLAEGLDAMEKAAANVERLARSLTSLGALGLEPAGAVDVNELVRGAVETLPAEAIETDLDGGVPAIQARGADVEKALGALLQNAREAAGSSGGKIRVSTRWDSAADSASIAVEDSGPGVPPEVRRRSFDPLFSTKGERGRGIGITLATLAAIIAGGSLEIEDLPAGGTRAVLRLPGPTQS